MGRFTIKNLKTYQTLDGGGWNCSLYLDGKKVGHASDEGHGGGCWTHIPRSLDAIFQEEAVLWMKTGASSAFKDYGESAAQDFFLTHLVNEIDIAKEVKKLRRKLAIFDGTDILKWKCSPEDESGRKYISENHPKAIILNDIPLDEAVGIYKNVFSL